MIDNNDRPETILTNDVVGIRDSYKADNKIMTPGILRIVDDIQPSLNVYTAACPISKKPLYLIVGKSGSGKDYITDKLCKDFNMKKVLSRTTRKKRNDEDNTHIFVSEEQADIEYPNAVKYTTMYGVRYYVLQEDLDGIDFYVINPDGIRNGKNISNQFILYIDSNPIRRIINMRKRGESFLFIIKRLFADRKNFRGFIGYKNFKNSNDLYDYIKGVVTWEV